VKSSVTLAGAGVELLEHLLIDRLMKAAIVVVALLILAFGMMMIWRIASRRR
jgi:hypothetical protein